MRIQGVQCSLIGSICLCIRQCLLIGGVLLLEGSDVPTVLLHQGNPLLKGLQLHIALIFQTGVDSRGILGCRSTRRCGAGAAACTEKEQTCHQYTEKEWHITLILLTHKFDSSE